MVYSEYGAKMPSRGYVGHRAAKSKTTFRRAGAALAVAVAFIVISAPGVAGDMFSFGSFGTVGVTHSSNDTGDYKSSLCTPSGAGWSHEYDMGLDSKLGAQVTGTISDQLSIRGGSDGTVHRQAAIRKRADLRAVERCRRC